MTERPWHSEVRYRVRRARGGFAIFALGVSLAACGGSEPPPVQSGQVGTPPAAPATPVQTVPAPPPVVSAPAPVSGGSPLLQETVAAIGIQNTLMESQMQAEAAANASRIVAKDQLQRISAERTAEMEAVLESMDQ